MLFDYLLLSQMLLCARKDLPLFYPFFKGREKLDQKEEEGELIWLIEALNIYGQRLCQMLVHKDNK